MPHQIRPFFILAVAVLLGGGIVFGIMQFQKAQQPKQNSVLAAQQEVATLIQQVGKLIELPTNEIPTIATVSDISKLTGKSFFTHAKNGDKVLIYSQSKEAILYRPSENKIISVAPVNIPTSPTGIPTSIATETPTPTTKVLLKPITKSTGTLSLSPSPANPTVNP